MARNKTSLREYQAAVVERLRSLGQRGASASSKLGFVVRDTRWIINLNEVAEVLPVPPVVPIPLTKPYFNGMCNVRGNLYGVVDFSAFMDKAPITRAVENRLLLLPPAVVQGAALLVSRMAGLRSPEAFVLADREPDTPLWVRNLYRDAEGHVWNELDVTTLAQHEYFLNVGR
ncbi:MAG: chemotaxis protein CheW [Pseudomonadota bacterium]